MIKTANKYTIAALSFALITACGGGGSDSNKIDLATNSPTTQTSLQTFYLARGVFSYFNDIGTKKFIGDVSATINGISYTGTSNYTVSNQLGISDNDMFNGLYSRFSWDQSNLFALDKKPDFLWIFLF